MKPHRLVLMAFALLATIGCRTRPETRAMFEAYQEEARRLEGVIYRLQYERDTACEENERLKKQLADSDGRTPRRTDTGPRLDSPRTPRPRSGATSPVPRSTPDDIDLSPPEIDPGPSTPPPTRNKPVTPEERADEPVETEAPLESEDELPPASRTLPESPDEPPLLPPRTTAPVIDVKPASPKTPELVQPEPETAKPEPPSEKSVPEEIPSPKPQTQEDTSLESDPPPVMRLPEANRKSAQIESDDEPPPNPPSILKPRSAPKTNPQEALPAPLEQSTPAKSTLPELLPAPTAVVSPPRDQQVAQLYLDPKLTRGLNLDDLNGDEGLRIVLEPRNAGGELVPVANKIVVDVYDPVRRTQLGHWEFDAATVRYQLRLAGKRHIALDIPWSEQKPLGTRLSVVAQMQNPSGSSVRASGEVGIVLPGQMAQRWTPRPPNRSSALAKKAAASEVIPATHMR